MKTYTPKAADAVHDWFVIDATGQNLGRLASAIAPILRGKHKPTFAPHMDMGDFVVVVNAGKIEVTGKKMTDKMYYRHTGHPGGISSTSLSMMLEKKPEEVIKLGVKGMLPKGPLGNAMLRKLKVYAAPTHPHEAQQPKVYSIQKI